MKYVLYNAGSLLIFKQGNAAFGMSKVGSRPISSAVGIGSINLQDCHDIPQSVAMVLSHILRWTGRLVLPFRNEIKDVKRSLYNPFSVARMLFIELRNARRPTELVPVLEIGP